jgi:hypothetical protein
MVVRTAAIYGLAAVPVTGSRIAIASARLTPSDQSKRFGFRRK